MSHSLEIRHLALRVSDLTRSAAFYVDRLGFTLAGQDQGLAWLSSEPGTPPVLTLAEQKSAAPARAEAAGLFHAALLFPSREALGGWLALAAKRGVGFEGFSDHAVSEAIYFRDPDGNGLEFYADRSREQWPQQNGEVEMTTRPLQLDSLLNAAAPANPPLAGSRWGHLHFRVTDLDRTESFYRELLALEVTQRSYPGARFMAADGYHHHFGFNVWGTPRQPRNPAALGLVNATIASSAVREAQDVMDPDGMSLRVEPLIH